MTSRNNKTGFNDCTKPPAACAMIMAGNSNAPTTRNTVMTSLPNQRPSASVRP
jgi:hypothetical protein